MDSVRFPVALTARWAATGWTSNLAFGFAGARRLTFKTLDCEMAGVTKCALFRKLKNAYFDLNIIQYHA